jgi:hypothetical protein
MPDDTKNAPARNLRKSLIRQAKYRLPTAMMTAAAHTSRDRQINRLVKRSEATGEKLPNNKIFTYHASGCRLAYSSAMNEVEVFEYEHDNKELYTKGYSKASNAGQFIDAWGRLSNHAADAS